MNSLPNEILHHIFSELPTSALLRFRLVNHRFKDLITPICRGQRHPSINFKWNSKKPKSEILDSFYKTFQNPLDTPWSGITLKTFEIRGSAGLQCLKHDEIQKFTRDFGPQVKKLEIIGYSIPALVNILNGCPNLKVLKFSENEEKIFMQSHCQNLLKLKNLKSLNINLTPYNCEFMEYFLDATTGLLEIRIDLYNRVIPTNKMLSQLAAIPNVSVNLTHYGRDAIDTCRIFAANRLHIKEFEFRTPVIVHGGPCLQDCKPFLKLTDFLSFNSQNLVKLIIYNTRSERRLCTQGFSIPTLENLKYLKLTSINGPRKQDLSRGISEATRKSESNFKYLQKFRNGQFPRLQIVEMQGIYFEVNPFQSAQFDSVKELIVKDEAEQINWHLIFPNLQRFTGNSFDKNKLSYIASNFPNLKHFKLGVQTADCRVAVNEIKLRIPDDVIGAYSSEFVQRDLKTVTLDFQGCTDTNESLDFYTNLIVNLPKMQYLGLFFTNISERVREAFKTSHQTFEQY